MSKTYTYTFLAKDLMSSKLSKIAGFGKKMGDDVESSSNRAVRALQKIQDKADRLQSIGTRMSLAITAPLVGLGTLAVKSAADLETLKTSLDTVFQDNKSLSNNAFENIKSFSAKTPFQLNEVATAFIKLKNLGLNPSIKSLTSYGNTASALGKSLDQMIEAVADASVGEFERLKEFGIKAKSQGDNVAFTFQGVTTVVRKNSQDISGYLQKIGNVNFAGSIERQANTFKGKLSTLKDNISQAFAGVGKIIINYINPFFSKINALITKFNELSPTTKKWIVIIGGVAAVIGPLLALAGTILPAIATGFTIITGPIGLIIAGLVAIGVIIYKNWAPIKNTLIDIANYFIDLYNESSLFRAAVLGVVHTFKTLWEIGKFVFEALKSVIGGAIQSFVDKFKTLGKLFKAIMTGNFKSIPDIIKDSSKQTRKNLLNTGSNLKKDWENLKKGLDKVQSDTITSLNNRSKISLISKKVTESKTANLNTEAAIKGGQVPPGGDAPKGLGKGIDAITGGGQRQTNITVSFDKLVENFTVHTETFEAGMDESLDKLKTMLLRVLNSTNQMQTSAT